MWLAVGAKAGIGAGGAVVAFVLACCVRLCILLLCRGNGTATPATYSP